MKHVIDPTVDIVFKAILGEPERKHLLIHFLNGILRLKGDAAIEEVTILNPSENDTQLDSKTIIHDVKAIDKKGSTFLIDTQVLAHAALNHRLLYTAAGSYFNNITRGQNYTDLRPVITIWLLADGLLSMPTKVHFFPDPKVKRVSPTTGLLQNDETLHIPFAMYSPQAQCYLTDQLQIHVLQLSLFDNHAKIKNEGDAWLYFFHNGKTLDPNNLPKRLQRFPQIGEAMAIVETFSENQANYEAYRSRLDAIRTQVTIESSLEQALMRERLAREAKEFERHEKERERAAKEFERHEKERERTAKEQERAAKEDALAEVARLKALLEQKNIQTD